MSNKIELHCFTTVLEIKQIMNNSQYNLTKIVNRLHPLRNYLLRRNVKICKELLKSVRENPYVKLETIEDCIEINEMTSQ